MSDPRILRGHTPRPTQEYGPVGPPRQAALAAELSGMHEMLRDALAEVLPGLLSDRSQSAESLIAARVKVDTQQRTRKLSGAVGGLVALLMATGGWAISQVRSYGDSRVAAVQAEAKADAAVVEAAETRATVDEHGARLGHLETKVDRALRILEGLEARPEAATEVVVPKPKGRK